MGKSNRSNPEGGPQNPGNKKGNKSLGEQLGELGEGVNISQNSPEKSISSTERPLPNKDSPEKLEGWDEEIHPSQDGNRYPYTSYRTWRGTSALSQDGSKDTGTFYPTKIKYPATIPKHVTGEVRRPYFNKPEDKAAFELGKQLLENKIFTPQEAQRIFEALEKGQVTSPAPHTIEKIPERFEIGQVFELPKDDISESSHWEIIKINESRGNGGTSLLLEQRDGQQKGRKEEFHPRYLKETLERAQLAKQRIEWEERNKTKKAEPTTDKAWTPAMITPAVLRPSSQVGKPSFLPIQDLFTMFNKKNGNSIKGIESWKRKWLDTGNIDKYREQFSNINISDEQIEDAKSSLSKYIELLKNENISKDIRSSIIGSIGINIRILTGVHHPTENDIQYYVENNILSGTNVKALSEHINGAPKTAIPRTVSPLSANPTPAPAPSPSPAPAPTPSQKKNPILRPLKTLSTNQDKKISIPGRPKTTVGAREEELRAENASKIYEKQRQETNSRTEIRQKFEKMFLNDENAFIALYTSPSINPTTNKIIYTSNEALRKHPYRDVIKQIFFVNNIEVVDQSQESLKSAEEKVKEKEYISRTNHGFSYRPTKEGFGNKNPTSIDGLTYNKDIQPSSMAKPSISGTINRYEELRAKVASTSTPDTKDQMGLRNRLKNREQEMNARITFAKDRRDTPKEESAHNSLKKAVDAYQDRVDLLVEKKEKEKEAALSPEAKRKKQEILKKVQDMVEKARYQKIREAAHKAGLGMWDNKVAILTFALAMTTGLPALKYYFDNKKTSYPPTADAVIKPTPRTTPSAHITPETRIAKKDWKKWFYESGPQAPEAGDELKDFYKNFPDDFETLSSEELLKKYVPEIGNTGDSASLDKILSSDAYAILYDNTTEMFPNMPDPKLRSKVSHFLRIIEKVSQSINADERVAIVRQGKMYNEPSDWFITPNISVRKYVEDIKKKEAQA